MENHNQSSGAGGVERFLDSLGEQLNSKTKQHLKKLYGCMIVALVAAACGAAAHDIAGPFKVNILCLLASAAFSLFLYISPERHEKKRLAFLAASSFLAGASIGQISTAVFLMRSSTIPMLLVSASIIFASFTLTTAFYANDRKGLYLGGVGLSLALTTLWVKLLDVVTGSRFLFYYMNLYTGLAFVCAFVLLHTHGILERGTSLEDYQWHPIGLLLNVFSVSCRVLVTIFLHPSAKKTTTSSSSSGGGDHQRDEDEEKQRKKQDLDRWLAEVRSDVNQETSSIVTNMKGEFDTLDAKVKDLQRETMELKKMAYANGGDHEDHQK